MMAEYTCHKCKGDFDEDDVTWADHEGQVKDEGNNFAWCVPCLPSQAISWGELADLTHATQVERFQFCLCEEQEQFPYDDCPKKPDTMQATRRFIKRAKEQRNATTNNEDFDYWHGIMEYHTNKLKTGEPQ
jgi:hypothetical protein